MDLGLWLEVLILLALAYWLGLFLFGLTVRPHSRRRAVYAEIKFDGELGEHEMDIGQKVTGSVSFTDKFGKPARVDGAPIWSVNDETLCSMVVAEDGMSAEFTALAEGGVLVNLEADADLGEGVKKIIGQGSINILPLEAIAAVISFGEPQDPA